MDRRTSVFQRAVGAASLIYVLACFVPWNPPKDYGTIEDSWILTLHAAFHEHLQFGTDIVFPFGPWGFLYGGYYPETHLVATITWSVLAVVFWWVAWDTARHFFTNVLVSGLWLMALIATMDTMITLNIDVRLTVYALLLLVRQFFMDDRPFAASEATLVVSLGLLSLIKFSLMVYIAIVVSIVALDTLLRQRRFPWPVPLYGAMLLVFWMLAGQRLSSIGPFVANSLRITGGYSEAMMLTGPREIQDVCLFSAAAALLIFLAGSAAWLRHRFAGMLFLMGWGFGLFVAFKYGYVRHDVHEVAAVLELLTMSLFGLALLWPGARKRGLASMVSILMLPLAIGGFATYTYARRPEHGWSRLRMLSWDDLCAPLRRDGRRKTLRDAYQEFLASVRSETPLPRLVGTTDAYDFNQVAVFAHGLRLRSRPVIQSYCAFSPELAELNAAFLRRDAAPENILFQLVTVDDRYPSLDDGLSWPELFTRYDLQDVEDTFVLLRRSSSPRTFRLILLRQVPLAFGDRIDVPAPTDGPIWAEIEISRTVAGSVASMLYKPPQLWFNVTLRDGRKIEKRLVPGMTKSGFLLSPFIEDNASFAALAAGQWTGELAASEVTALSIAAVGGSSAEALYRNPMSVRLYRLDYPGQDVRSVTGYQQMAHLRRLVRSASILSANQPPHLIYAPGAGTLLDLPRQSAVLFRPPQGARHLKLKFGIREGDRRSLPVTSGILLRLSFVNAQGEPVPFWSQRMDPSTQVDAKGTHEFSVELQGIQSSLLILETLPVESGTTDTTTAFLADVEFEPN